MAHLEPPIATATRVANGEFGSDEELNFIGNVCGDFEEYFKREL